MVSENLHFSQCGLALTQKEQEGLAQAGLEFTGWYNQHKQPILRNTRTGEELALCRMGYSVAVTCNVYLAHEDKQLHMEMMKDDDSNN